MARLLTTPVTVVQGDDAPDLVLTLQQDSSGLPYNLNAKAAYAVIVEAGSPDEYVHKFPIEVTDETAGKVTISWIKDPVELTSYLDDLEPGKRYEIQIFITRTDLPPTFITFDAYYSYFAGDFQYSGVWQEGAPVFKHATEELFLSRSPYDGNALPNEFVWLVTSLRAAQWYEVKAQDKTALSSADLELIPVWNYRQVLSESQAPNSTLHPSDTLGFETSGDYIITPDGKFATIPAVTLSGAGISGVNRTYVSNTAGNLWHINGSVGSAYFISDETTEWVVVKNPEFTIPYRAPDVGEDVPPEGGWVSSDPSEDPAPVGSPPFTWQQVEITDIADAPTDLENRGTQTVLTHIPLKVKPAYRLADEN